MEQLEIVEEPIGLVAEVASIPIGYRVESVLEGFRSKAAWAGSS